MEAVYPSFEPGTGQRLAGSTTAGRAGVPLFHAAWLFALGITAAHWLWLRPSWLLLATFVLGALCAAAAFRAQRILWVPLAALWLMSGAWCAEMEPAPAPAAQLAALSDGLTRTVEGTVVDAGLAHGELEENLDQPAAAERLSQRIDLRVSSIEVVTDSSDAQAAVAGQVRLTVRWPAGSQPNQIACGERIRVVARLLMPETYRDPGVWSREAYLADKGITSTASLSADQVERLGKSDGALPACRISGWQHLATARLLALPAAMRWLPAPMRLSADDAVMLAAMVAGDRTYLTRSLRVGFERTGSFHMLVVSGFHLAIVAACIFWITRRLRLPRVPATLLTIAASAGYALFTGFATPVQRSLWMVTLYLLARIAYRERSPLNTIGFAALCLLAWSPRSLFDASLQMTLLAVVAVAGIAAPLLAATIHPYVGATRDLQLTAIDQSLPPKLAQFRETLRMFVSALADTRVERTARWVIPSAIRIALRGLELLVVSLVIELAMSLPMALYFDRITLFALPVNLFILPLLLVLMPVALFTLIVALVWPAAAVIPAAVAAVPLHFGVWLVRGFGSLAAGDLRIPPPVLAQSIGFCALLATAAVLARGASWQRRGAWLAMILAAVAAVAPRPIHHPHGALLVEAIDVGQGDSLLLMTPDGKTMLVDAGGFGGGPRQAPQDFDIGEEVVSQALWARGIRHLDVVALTHAHSDHMGGMPAVLRNFRPDQLWVGNNPPVPAYTALLSQAAGLGVSIRSLRAGDALTLGTTQISVLAPFRSYQPGPEPTNNDSLVLHVAYGATSVMLEGDAEAPVEQAMLAESGLGSTLLKVGHHGSITSTRPEFLARVAPRWAVISCGLRNRYGHPRQEALHELQAANVRTFATDIDGAVCFQLDGKAVTVDSSCAGRQLP